MTEIKEIETLKKLDSGQFNYDKNNEDYSIRSKIVLIEIVSIFCTIASCAINGFSWSNNENATSLAVTTDGFLNTLTYALVIWCYFRRDHLHSKRRDQTTQIILSIIFLLSSTITKFIAMKNLVFKVQLNWSVNFILTNLGQSIVFSILSILKFFLSTRFTYSSTLHASGFNSLLTSLSTLSLAMSMILLMNESSLYFFDSLMGFFIALVLNAFGSNLLIRNVCN
jgi:hypothetical protein